MRRFSNCDDIYAVGHRRKVDLLSARTEALCRAPSAERVVDAEHCRSNEGKAKHLEKVLAEPGVQIRIFGKPEIVGHRRMGVILATADSTEEAIRKADRAFGALQIEVLPR